MGHSYTQRTIKVLFAEASCCAYPGCDEPLLFHDRGETTVVADIAHIRSAKASGPRHDPAFTGDLDGSDNLLLLCGRHHRPVDSHESVYSIGELEQWKVAQRATAGSGTPVSDREVQRFLGLSDEERQTLAHVARLTERVVIACETAYDAINAVELARRRAIAAAQQGLGPIWQVDDDGNKTLINDRIRLPHVEELEWQAKAHAAFAACRPEIAAAVGTLREEVAVLRMMRPGTIAHAGGNLILAAEGAAQVVGDAQSLDMMIALLRSRIATLWAAARGEADIDADDPADR